MLFGIDVSKWQAQPDWQAVKDSGVAYAIAKATEGWGYIDPEFRRNWSEIRRVGIPVRGAYHFARPDLGSSPQTEADWFLEVVQPEPGDLLALDAESVGGSASWCLAFLDRIWDRLSGYRALFYSYVVWINSRGLAAEPRLAGYPLWLAWPDSNGPLYTPAPWSAVSIQQYGYVRVPGISGDVDANRFFGDSTDLRRLTIGGGQEEDMTGDEHNALIRASDEIHQLWTEFVKYTNETPGKGTTGQVLVDLHDKVQQVWSEGHGPDYVAVAGGNVSDLILQIRNKLQELQQPVIDAAAAASIAAELKADPEFLAAIAKAVNDDDAADRRNKS